MTAKTEIETTETPAALVTWGVFTFKKPNAVAWVSTVLLVGLCLWLGTWQLQRLEWKQALITKIEAAQKAPRVIVKDLPKNLDEMGDLEFRSIILPGHYEYAHEFHLVGRRSDEGEPGYHVITPFRMEEHGGAILVNRGWVPSDKKEPENRKEDPRFDGLLLISGMLVKPSPAPSYMPKNDTEHNVWLLADIDAMSKIAGEKFPPVILEVINPTPPPGTLPIPRKDGNIELRNDHLNYALTWFSLAFAGLAIFFIYHLHSMKGDEDEPAKG